MFPFQVILRINDEEHFRPSGKINWLSEPAVGLCIFIYDTRVPSFGVVGRAQLKQNEYLFIVINEKIIYNIYKYINSHESRLANGPMVRVQTTNFRQLVILICP